MQSLRILILLLVVSPLGYGQQQYSEGACILLKQQADRFAHQLQNSNYRSAMREYDKYCRKPVAPRPVATNSNPAPIANNIAVAVPVKQATIPAAATPAPEPIAVKPEPKAVTATAEPTLSPEQTATLTAEATNAEQEPAVANADASTADRAISDMANSPETTTGSQTKVTVNTVADHTKPVEPGFWSDALLMQLLSNMPVIAANIFALLAAIFLLTSWLGFNLPGFKGVFAEYKLNRLLRWRLPRQYLHFRKLKLLTAKDEPTMIDHLVLCPAGIFVIAVRTNRGRISGSETAANWTRQYFGNSKQLMNPLHQNYKNIRAVQHLLQLQNGDASECLHSVVAFSRVARFDSQMPANVTYVDAVAAYIKQFEHSCFTDEQVARFAALLKQASTDQ